MECDLYWRNAIRAGFLDADEHQWLSDGDNKCRGIVSLSSVCTDLQGFAFTETQSIVI